MINLNKKRIYSFPPIIDRESRVIILGSIPGRESLERQEYYAHPRNHFWPIIFELFDLPLAEDYQQKIKFLKSKQIALWDVVEGCFRQGSLDGNIKDAKVNDLQGLFREYPNLKHIFFNGGKAYELFKRNIGTKMAGLNWTKLNSTSPANTKGFDYKLREWQSILEILNKK